jgi:hypothetical protein
MFNSKDWLGKVDDWKIKHRSSDEYNYPLITELHTKYGNGNQLNKEQIKDFLEKITKVIRWSPITIDLSEYTVYEYNVDPNVYKQLPKRFK